MGTAADLNLYAYVGNNPINFTDPNGESPVSDVVKAIIKTFEPGPFATKSLPATGAKVTASESKAITEIGKEAGCHICGSPDPGTTSGKFVGDHMPPTSIAAGQSQRLFPSCMTCSNTQGGYLSGIAKTAVVAVASVTSTVTQAATAIWNGIKDDPLGSVFYTLQSTQLGDGTLKHRSSALGF